MRHVFAMTSHVKRHLEIKQGKLKHSAIPTDSFPEVNFVVHLLES